MESFRGSSSTPLSAVAFNTAAVAAAKGGTPDVFLNDALARLAELLDLDACAILVPEEEDVRAAAAIGLPADWLDARGKNELPDGFRSCWPVPLTAADGDTLGLFVAYGRGSDGPGQESLGVAAAYGSLIAMGLDRLRVESDVAARYHAVVVALASALDARDEHPVGHWTETSNLAQSVGRRLGMDAAGLELMSQVSLLHDVGKLGVPTEVLLKSEALAPHEVALVREHPVIGERILSGIPGFGEVATAIRCVHERWDGLGYPDGRAGEQIPLASRIASACDAWSAMTTGRPYRPAVSHSEARAQLRTGAGRQFDPRVAQALLEALGDHTPLPVGGPSDSRDRALSLELAALATELGAEDLFVFSAVAGGHYSHLGGAGRGAGWAGSVELELPGERHLRAAVSSGAPTRVALARAGRIVGSYDGRSAVIVPGAGQAVVVFGSSSDALARASIEHAVRLAERACSLVMDVSPAKRLADELEVLAAVGEVTVIAADSLDGALSSIAVCARGALSVEFAAVATIPSSEIDWALGISAGDWTPGDPDAVTRALAHYGARVAELPMLCQDVAEMPHPVDGFRHTDGVSSMHVLPIGSPAVAILLVVHATPGLRGFTALSQRVASEMSEAADVVLRRVLAQERLRAENAQLADKLRTDELTGVASRVAWSEALRAEELHRGRSGSPVTVVMVDVDRLKVVNDVAGHAAGDDLLRRCAQLLADSVRATDLVARIGGDEFGVLLRYTDAGRAREWCERLLAGEASAPRLSFGYASVPPLATVAEAVRGADRRMYESKLARRAARL